MSDEEQQEEVPMTKDRDRKELAKSVELNPASLVGSWFHRVENDQIIWGGIVVGEVQPGYYLVEVEQGLSGAEKAAPQILVRLDAMLAKEDGYEWRLYDTKEKMTDAYAEYLVASEVA